MGDWVEEGVVEASEGELLLEDVCWVLEQERAEQRRCWETLRTRGKTRAGWTRRLKRMHGRRGSVMCRRR